MKKEKHRKMHGNSAQSAMEYLMTYGWAILIIAVVLAVLFSMGITNPLFFAPKAVAGGCQVIKTQVSSSIEGVCNNEIPTYVAQFNGQTSYINIPSSAQISTTREISVFAWININSLESAIIEKQGSYGMKIGVSGAAPGKFAGYVWGTDGVCNTVPFYFKTNMWYFVGFTYDGNKVYEYVNGKFYCELPFFAGIDISTSPLALGGPNDIDGYVNGSISNLQIYNVSLSSTAVSALYREGIGGAPIEINNLVGWWPLNRNAKDYSGNNNDGSALNIIWSGTWWQDYSAP